MNYYRINGRVCSSSVEGGINVSASMSHVQVAASECVEGKGRNLQLALQCTFLSFPFLYSILTNFTLFLILN